jgi:hypothetical protein
MLERLNEPCHLGPSDRTLLQTLKTKLWSFPQIKTEVERDLTGTSRDDPEANARSAPAAILESLLRAESVPFFMPSGVPCRSGGRAQQREPARLFYHAESNRLSEFTCNCALAATHHPTNSSGEVELCANHHCGRVRRFDVLPHAMDVIPRRGAGRGQLQCQNCDRFFAPGANAGCAPCGLCRRRVCGRDQCRAPVRLDVSGALPCAVCRKCVSPYANGDDISNFHVVYTESL